MSNHSDFSITLFSKREAAGKGGFITGLNPAAFTTSDPLRLWMIQVGIIIIVAQLLSLGLRRLKQPKVIAEVLGGILLGPTALGRIPGFTENIFPDVSLPYLSLVGDIGLCLFLFIIGLEIDTSIVKRNARTSFVVSLAGIILPFGLGACLSIPLYHYFIDHSIHFPCFMVFVGVAYSITAFPVLCGILTEFKLLDTHVGIIVLSASAGNDIVGWTLLALSVALVNARSALSALWILLVCIAFAIFLLMPIKFVMRWLARKTGSIEDGPTIFYMAMVMILVWVCGFFTDSIGLNAIFGAFLAGLVVPREGGLAITLTEKLEDMVSIVFLPLHFTLSGLNTNLRLLDGGVTWAFTIAIIALSFSGKFGGCTIASRLAGFGWRESGTVGALMSCKGIVALIVLNVGLDAGILSQQLFSMFVLEALILTVITTPLVRVLYPPERRIRVGEIALPADDGELGKCDEKVSILSELEEEPWRHRFTVVLDKLDHIPGAMSLTQLFIPPRSTPSGAVSPTTTVVAVDQLPPPYVSVEALELIELSNRTSATMKSSAADSLIHTDPMLGIFRTFGELNGLDVTTSLSVVPYDDFARSVADHAQRHGSHLILLPWLLSAVSAAPAVDTPDVTVAAEATKSKVTKSSYNPFDILFGGVSGSKDNSVHSQFVQSVFEQSKTDVAVYIDTGHRPKARVKGDTHIFFPFFGGPDDRLALEFVVQLCLNPMVTATVVRMVRRDVVVDEGEKVSRPETAHLGNRDNLDRRLPPILEGPSVSTIASLDTVYDSPTSHLQSETIDQIVWSKYASPSLGIANTVTPGLQSALARIQFSEVHTPEPVYAVIRHARALRKMSPRLLMVSGRSRRLATESHHVEMKRLRETYRSGVGPVGMDGMRRTIGDVGTAMTVAVSASGSASAVVVLQAALRLR